MLYRTKDEPVSHWPQDEDRVTQPHHLSLRIMSIRSVSHIYRIIYQKPNYLNSHARTLSFYSLRAFPFISLSLNLQDDTTRPTRSFYLTSIYRVRHAQYHCEHKSEANVPDLPCRPAFSRAVVFVSEFFVLGSLYSIVPEAACLSIHPCPVRQRWEVACGPKQG